METMTLTIQVPQNIGSALEEKAKNQGEGVARYVEKLIEKDIDRQKHLTKSSRRSEKILPAAE